MAKSIIPHTKWSASKTALLNLLIEHGGQTIAELSNSLGVSVPYTTKTLNELIEDGLIEVTGKKDNYSKRSAKDLQPHRNIRIFPRHRYRKAKSHLRHL